MPLDFGRPEKPAKPAVQKVEVGALEIIVDAAGQLLVRRRGEELLRAAVLAPWLAPATVASAPPRLTEGKLTKEDVCEGRHCFRLTGTLVHEGWGGTAFEYEARFHLGVEPLLCVEYVQLRNPGPPGRLSHWEHHLEINGLVAVQLAGDAAPRCAPVFDLVLEAGARTPRLAAQANGRWLVVDSGDVDFYTQGALTLGHAPRTEGIHHLGLHRITPGHFRSGALRTVPEPLEVETGAAISCAFALDLRDSAPAAEALAIPRRAAPLRCVRPPEILLLQGAAADDELARRLRAKVAAFTIDSGRLAGLHHAGYDHLNRRPAETPTSRAECGQFMLNEHWRGGDEWWLNQVLRFGRAQLDLAPPPKVGATAQCGRAAHLFLRLHGITGDARYLAAARVNGERAAQIAADAQAQHASACPDLAALWYHTGGGQYGTAARQIATQVAARQSEDGSWYRGAGTGGAADHAAPLQGGDHLDWPPAYPGAGAAGASHPGVVSSAVIGLLDMAEILACAEGIEAARRALDWMVSTQQDEGTWALPGAAGRALWGDGAFQGALALFRGYQRFDDDRYRLAGERAFDWALETWDRVGYIPAVVGLWPHDQSEGSLGYFYGLEAAALRRELGG